MTVLDPRDPRAPKFWMSEQGSILRPAVEAYLYRQPLSAEQVSVLSAYLRQWIKSPVWEDGSEIEALRESVDSLTNSKQIRAWLSRALDAGIDPL